MISILVPVYNVEKYLRRCVDSILAQTYRNYEIILLDDGSTDRSGAVCDAYAAEHDCIRVIHQKNAGVSQARNVLLAAARGEFITFLDSDDSLEPKCLETLLQDLRDTGADISICSWCEVSEEGISTEITWDRKDEGFRIWTTEEAVKHLLYQESIDTNLWGKLYRREVLKDVVFPVGKAYEDLAAAYQVFLKANGICYRPEALYRYTSNTKGISQSTFAPRRMDLIDNVEVMSADIGNRYPQYRAAAQARLLRAYIHVYLQIPGGAAYEPYRNRVVAGIRKNRFAVARNPEAKRGTRMAALLACVHPVLLRLLNRWKVYAK